MLTNHLTLSGAGCARGRHKAHGPHTEPPSHGSACAFDRSITRSLPRILRLAPNLKVGKICNDFVIKGTS